MRRRGLACIAFLPLAASAAWAGAGAGLEALEQRLRERPTVVDLVAYANEKSPMIRAARQFWRATVEKRRVATAWPDPELMFE